MASSIRTQGLPKVLRFAPSPRFNRLVTFRLNSASRRTPNSPSPDEQNFGEHNLETVQGRINLYNATFKVKTEEQSKELFNLWAETYEKHYRSDLEYKVPVLGADLLSAHLTDKTANILDIGAGTGFVGEALHGMGYKNIDALDLSEEMLKRAAKKNIYGKIIVESATNMKAVEDESYDAAICVGAFNFGHIPATALHEFLRVLKPGSLITFTNRIEFYRQELQTVEKELTDKGVWELVEKRHYEMGQAIADGEHFHFCFRKN